jgi:ElaB/YqjD/DUF883 family membrane-anchored ribosome-binding protein
VAASAVVAVGLSKYALAASLADTRNISFFSLSLKAPAALDSLPNAVNTLCKSNISRLNSPKSGTSRSSRKHSVMNEALRRMPDTPNFDTYPSAPPNSGNNGSVLEQRARQIGAVVGKAVVVARQAQDKLKNVTGDVGKNVGDLAGTAKAKANELAEEITARASDVQSVAQEKAAELLDQAERGIHRARYRVYRLFGRHPVQVALAAGVIGLVIGAALRLGRSNHGT